MLGGTLGGGLDVVFVRAISRRKLKREKRGKERGFRGRQWRDSRNPEK